jgi:glycine dehydrogenase subunit 2
VLLKTYAYISRLGDGGLKDTSAMAVLNANYLASQVDLDIPYGPFHHEFVASAGDVDAAEFAKGMLDEGVHPPTTKWPEIVDEALMTEPTEALSKEQLDVLAAAFTETDRKTSEELSEAPTTTAAARIDQASAARNPQLSWRDVEGHDE